MSSEAKLNLSHDAYAARRGAGQSHEETIKAMQKLSSNNPNIVIPSEKILDEWVKQAEQAANKTSQPKAKAPPAVAPSGMWMDLAGNRHMDRDFPSPEIALKSLTIKPAASIGSPTASLTSGHSNNPSISSGKSGGSQGQGRF